MRRRLGKRIDRKERKKASPLLYPDEGPCGLADAYAQLSHQAFAVWVRLAVAERSALRMGRARLSKLLGYSRRQGDQVMRELELKGFIAFVPHGPWRKTIVVIVRKPLLETGHSFARLAWALGLPASATSSFKYFTARSLNYCIQSEDGSANYYIQVKSTERDRIPHNAFSYFTQTPGSSVRYCTDEKSTETVRSNSPRFTVCAEIYAAAKQFTGKFYGAPKFANYLPTPTNERQKFMRASRALRTETRKCPSLFSPRVKRRKFISEESYCRISPAYRDQLDQFKLEELERRRLLRSSNRARREARNAANRARGIQVLDWNDLDVVTFDPRRQKHRVMCAVLQRKARDPERMALVRRLETEFCRLYTRYRRAAERAKGRAVVDYVVTPRERKYAAQAAELCVLRGVTPRQLMEYWHRNLKHFRRASHQIVPALSFLSAPANIDTVACDLVADEAAVGGARIGGVTDATDPRPKNGHSFADTSQLDVRLRAELERAGFSTAALDDRYLLTVQANAMGLAKGRDIFIGKGPLRDMSRWAAKHLYAK